MPPPASVPQAAAVRKRRPGRPPNVNNVVQQVAPMSGEDETSLYYILRNSKASLNVNFLNVFYIIFYLFS